MDVGFIGFGPKGSSIAHALADAGHAVFAWADDPGAGVAMEDRPHTVCGSLAELASRCDVVQLCVDRERLEEVVYDGGLLDLLPAGAIVATHGVESPEACVRLAEDGAARDIGVLDAPVSVPMTGRAPGEPPWGVVMVGGDAAVVERCRTLFGAFARRLFHVGPAGLGDVAKLMNNTLYAASLANAADALELAAGLGYDLDVFVELIQDSSGASFGLGSLATTPPGRAEPLRVLLDEQAHELGALLAARGIEALPLLDSARRGAVRVGDALRLVAAQPERGR